MPLRASKAVPATPQEIEIKLALPPALARQPEALARLLASTPVLARRKSQRQRVFSTYYDTPDQALRRQRTALRLRRIGPPEQGHWVQTLKTAGLGTSALTQRGEWEMPVPAAAIDTGLLATSPWPQLDPHGEVAARLAPCFTTDFERTTWIVALPGGARIEVALDLGEITAGQQQLPLAELELELLSGPPAALFTLAHRIARTLPLMPLAASKAERGFALHQRADLPAQMAGPPALPRDLALPAVAHHVLAEAFGHWIANLHGLQSAHDADRVHQARVGWRRLQSLRRLLLAGLPDTPLAALVDRHQRHPVLRSLRTHLGQLRDLDVARMQTLLPLARAYTQGNARREVAWHDLQQRLDHATQQALNAVREALQQPAMGQILLAWLQGIEALRDPALAPPPPLPPQSSDTAAVPEGGKPTRRWLRKRLQQLARRLDAALLWPDHADAQHQARLLAKRLRYCTESLAPLLPQRLRERAATATRWQEQLGTLRDLQRAAELAVQLQADPELAEFLRGVALGVHTMHRV